MRRTVLRIALFLVGLASPLNAQTQKRLWVLEQPDRIAEYDLNTFAPKQSLSLPPEILRHPENLAINNKGEMLFASKRYEVAFSPEQNSKLWFWNGHTSTLLDRGLLRIRTSVGPNFSVVEAIPQPFLSVDGAHLLWFANVFKRLEQKNEESESAMDVWVTTIFRAWQTDLAGGGKEQVAAFQFPTCKCTTGSCEESCPEASFWVPDEGVIDFFIVTHWIPGQLGPDYQSSFLYQKSGGKWSEKKLPHPMDPMLDAANGGAIIIEANADAGCCGWVNESDDQTLLTGDGKTTVLFDERERFHNADYDVSFYTPIGKLAPKLDFIALEIASTARAGDEIRLSSDGKPNAGELAQIQQALADLPAVEVLSLEQPPKRTTRLPHASLVGWLNDNEILVIEDQQLVAFNISTGSKRRSEIKVPKWSYVFLR